MTNEHQSVYVRKDDPQETVFVINQARSVDGPLLYEVLTPDKHAGRQVSVPNQRDFFDSYRKMFEEPEPEPIRPLSTDTSGAWRKWALHLEEKLASAEASLRRAMRDNPGWW